MSEILKHGLDPDMSEAAINRRIRRLGDLHDLARSLQKAIPLQPATAPSPPLVRESPASPPIPPVPPT